MNKVSNAIPAFFVFIFMNLQASPATIKGFEPDYAGQTLVFKTYTDPVTKNEQEFFSISIDKNGYFKKGINLGETAFCHADFGVYHGLLIVEPGSEIKLRLPAFREKTLLESKNPYFKPAEIWLRVESDKENEINKLVSGLEKMYTELTNKYFNQLYFRKSQAHFDSVKTILNNEFSKYSHPVIKARLSFKLKILATDTGLADEHTVFKGIKPDNLTFYSPAFSGLLAQVFSNKLSFEANLVKGGRIKTAVETADVQFIKKYFQEKYSLVPEMAGLVLLKLFHDAYYTNQFSKQSILAMIGSPLFSAHPDIKTRGLATALKEKLLFLSPGSQAPVICLKSPEGQEQCSDKQDGYLYLIFADTEMLVCIEHLKYLSAIGPKFKGQLNFFIVAKNTGTEGIRNFFEENEIPGVKVIDNAENRVAASYKVRSYPAAFLLDENHNVVLAPAKNPLDGFESEFTSILRAEQIRRFRNQR